jgi:molybdate transport system permease protein
VSGTPDKPAPQRRRRFTGLSDTAFYGVMTVIGGTYVLLILLLLAADMAYVVQSREGGQGLLSWLVGKNPIIEALAKPEIRYSIVLSLVSCTLSAIISVWVAVPLGYLLARFAFPGRNLIDAILDIPIVLPPLVIGLSLLILFQFWPFIAKIGGMLPFPTPWDSESLNSLIVYQVPSVVIAQFMVASAFAVRVMRATFDHINPRCEQVALTLGCSRAQAFGYVVLPEARRGMLTAFTLAWARSLGEFGPLLIFSGATRNKTEVLSTTVFLELSIGDLEAAVAVSLIMVAAAMTVLLIARMWGSRELSL